MNRWKSFIDEIFGIDDQESNSVDSPTCSSLILASPIVLFVGLTAHSMTHASAPGEEVKTDAVSAWGGISVEEGERRTIRSSVVIPGNGSKAEQGLDRLVSFKTDWGELVVARPLAEAGFPDPFEDLRGERLVSVLDMVSEILGSTISKLTALSGKTVSLTIFSSHEANGYSHEVSSKEGDEKVGIVTSSTSLKIAAEPAWWRDAIGFAAHEMTHLNHMLSGIIDGRSRKGRINAEAAASIAEFCAEIAFEGRLMSMRKQNSISISWEAVQHPNAFPHLKNGSAKPVLDKLERWNDPTNIGKVIASAVMQVATGGTDIPLSSTGEAELISGICHRVENSIPDFIAGEDLISSGTIQ